MSVNARERGFGDCRKPDFRKNNIVAIKGGGVKMNVHKDIDLLAICFLAEMESLHGRGALAREADDWGWNFRPIRGYEAKYKATHDERYLSNHSWGVALDINSKTNPMGPKRTTFKVNETRVLCYKYGFSWGYDYAGARKDVMHFEFLGTAADARRRKAELAKQLKALG